MTTRRWAGLLLSFGLLGCTSTESRCETLCHWANKCGGTETNITCSDDAIDECVDSYDDEGDSCQEAFDDFADCVDEEDQNCSSVENNCIAEGTEFVERCDFSD
jgi:hypothetical protein